MSTEITLIIGPTGIGKSHLAMRMAQDSGAQIISADAFQVYKGMDIGTAKPSPTDQKTVPHHLIDTHCPTQAYDAQQFVTACNTTISQCQSHSVPVIICGGAAFYIKAWLYQYEFSETTPPTPLSDPSPDTLWARLNTIDPERAAALHPNDHKRLIRALHIAQSTGQLPSERPWGSGQRRQDVRIIGLRDSREQIYARINDRVSTMMDMGLLEEVHQLLSQYPNNAHGFQAVGYKELIGHIEGEYDLPRAIQLIQQHSRHYAKHQLTWFNRFEGVAWTV